MRNRILRPILIAVTAVAVVVLVTTVARSETFATFTAALGGASNDAIATCSDTAITIDNVRTAYSNSPSQYEVRSVRFATVPAACVGKQYSLTILDYKSPYASLATKTGTVPASGSTVSFAAGNGANVNSINNTTEEIGIALAVTG